MSMKITEIQAPDGAKIYMQYEEIDVGQLQAVGVFEDIEERTKIFKQELLILLMNMHNCY